MNGRIDNITLKGFKTIGDLTEFRPGPINLFIGPNGAGKSNFISFFRLLSWMMRGDLQQHVGSQGGASALLHKGAEVTRTVEAKLSLRTDRGENEYEFWLGHAAGDTFIFNNERYRFSAADFPGKADWTELDAGHREARIVERAEQGEPTARVIRGLIRNCIVYQFHNTSDNARIRQKWSADDNTLLKEDGANLAPFLLRLQEEYPLYYHRIVEHLRLVLPFFKDFEITRDRFGFAILRWSERHNDMVFSASQAADGMIRCMAMIALLGQPEDQCFVQLL
jgi:predicted ATPase